MMPGMDGFEVCGYLKADPETRDIPVIFLSALDDTANKVKGFAAGAVDYVSKPFQPEEVQVRVNTHLTMSLLKQSLAEKNAELQAYSEHLEERVRERTAELDSLNKIYERFVPREFIDLLKRRVFSKSIWAIRSAKNDRYVCGHSRMDYAAGKDDPAPGIQFHQCLSQKSEPGDQGLQRIH